MYNIIHRIIYTQKEHICWRI